MKKSFVIIIVITAVVVSGCLDDSTDHESTTSRDYRQDMRDFVKGISVYAKGINPYFIIIPQNGHELLTDNGEPAGLQATEYIDAIDGAGQEDPFYGYYDDNVATPQSERSYLIALMDIAESNSVEVLVTD
ncbi:MAG: endo alpha-1,4 polygalactosaminidase, partial [Candidatus Thorarchaeota archaeon]